MAHYLVTGGAGFIGSHLSEEIARRGHRVRVADSLITGKRTNLDHIPGVEFMEGDLAELEFATKAAAGCDYVLHQAAIPSVPRSVKDPITSNRANVDATLNMLVAARDAGVKRFVFAASSSAYGDTPTLPKHEQMPTNPLSPYALQKVVGEQYLQMFTKLYKLETVSIRYFNVFGPRQDPAGPYAAVIPRWFAALRDGAEIVVHGDGETSRDFCFVENVVQANLLAATTEDPQALGQVYNVAFGERTTLNELFVLVRERVACAVPGARDVRPRHGPFRAGDVRHSLADVDKARRLLGYAPDYSVREGLDRAAEWYLSRPAVG
jgi:nucleoside-diphosphate-sugar epimerase